MPKVEDVTTYPSILGGRVKTLHPKIFGGILGRRENEGDKEQMAQYEIPEIDLVIVDLYPFEDTVASGASDADIIEKIDIGGHLAHQSWREKLQGRSHRAQQGRVRHVARSAQQKRCRDRHRGSQEIRRARIWRKQPLRHSHP